MDLEQIKREVDLIDFVRAHYGIGCNSKGLALCPFHKEKNPSFEIKKFNGMWGWRDWHLSKEDPKFSGTIIDLVAQMEGLSDQKAISKLKNMFAAAEGTTKKTTETKYYQYHDQEGNVVYRKAKQIYENGKKRFWIELKDQKGWRKPLRNEDYKKYPYRAHKFKKYKKVIVCEGEKDADAVNELNTEYLATSAPFGCKSWPDNLTFCLSSFHEAIFIYDVGNEADARNHSMKILDSVPEIKLYIVQLPMTKKEDDISDYLISYHSLAEKKKVFMELLKLKERLTDNKNSLKTNENLKKAYTGKELLETKFPFEPMWIGHGILPKSGYMIVAGDAKEGKSTLCIQMALSLISSHPFLGKYPIHDKARVLYLFAEGTMQGIQEILETQVKAARGIGWNIKDSDLENISFEEEKDLSLNQPAGSGYAILSKIINRENADIVFIDPISLFCTTNLDKLENVSKLRAGLNKITGETGCTWVIIHHYRKPKEDEGKAVHRIAGSAGWGNYCESFLGLEQAHKKRSENYKKINFLLRRAITPDPLFLFRDPSSRLFSIVGKDKVLQPSITISNVLAELNQYEPEGIEYMPFADKCSEKYGVSTQRIAGLLTDAEKIKKTFKERGKHGKWHIYSEQDPY